MIALLVVLTIVPNVEKLGYIVLEPADASQTALLLTQQKTIMLEFSMFVVQDISYTRRR